MKKIILIIFSLTVLISCESKTVEDARKIKVGMTTEELQKIMGEPYRIQVNADHEDWYFSYSYKNYVDVYIINNKVTNFYTF